MLRLEKIIIICALHLRCFHAFYVSTLTSNNLRQSIDSALKVRVWIEQAEENFIDSDENLMHGEVCLRAIKAFANDPNGSDEKRFLCAGALVQRPNSNIRDAWMADTLTEEPNIQMKGASLILDDLFYHHLTTSNAHDLYEVISTFIVQSGRSESEYHAGSNFAVRSRGFKTLEKLFYDEGDIDGGIIPVKDLYRKHLIFENEDIDSMVFSVHDGFNCYASLSDDSTAPLASKVSAILQRIQNENQSENMKSVLE